MKVYVANFGLENYEWPRCKTNDVVATMQDGRLHPFWVAGDRAGYIDYCTRELKTARGIAPIPAVAGRWYNLGTIITETEGDLWLHGDGQYLWWTVTKAEPATITLEPDPKPTPGSSREVYFYRKPCERWGYEDRKGRRLNWRGLHPKSHDFFATEATLQQLGERYAGYAIALINGDPLDQWHELPEWKAKLGTKSGTVQSATARERTIFNMVLQAEATAAQSNGQQMLRTIKNKEFRFASRDEAKRYVAALLESQEGLCAITGLSLQFDDGDDKALRCSLDRIDSNGHYEPGNLQIVCRFINSWKSAGDNEEFKRLISLVRTVAVV
jgi:hypothetical protein